MFERLFGKRKQAKVPATPAPTSSFKLTQVNENVRIEAGPSRRQADATPELFASGKLDPKYRPGMNDAHGRKISIGKKFDYLDWKAPYVWYVYKRDETGRYLTVAVYPTHDAALEAARALT